jgi:hypothetical protein
MKGSRSSNASLSPQHTQKRDGREKTKRTKGCGLWGMCERGTDSKTARAHTLTFSLSLFSVVVDGGRRGRQSIRRKRVLSSFHILSLLFPHTIIITTWSASVSKSCTNSLHDPLDVVFVVIVMGFSSEHCRLRRSKSWWCRCREMGKLFFPIWARNIIMGCHCSFIESNLDLSIPSSCVFGSS